MYKIFFNSNKSYCCFIKNIPGEISAALLLPIPPGETKAARLLLPKPPGDIKAVRLLLNAAAAGDIKVGCCELLEAVTGDIKAALLLLIAGLLPTTRLLPIAGETRVGWRTPRDIPGKEIINHTHNYIIGII